MISCEEVFARLWAQHSEGKKLNLNYYTNSDLNSVQSSVKEFLKELEKPTPKPKLSLRRALVVLLHERFYKDTQYPQNYNPDERLYKPASSRFKLAQKKRQVFIETDQVLSKTPCLYYGDNGNGKRHFRETLEFFFKSNLEYFEVPEAKDSLQTVLEKFYTC